MSPFRVAANHRFFGHFALCMLAVGSIACSEGVAPAAQGAQVTRFVQRSTPGGTCQTMRTDGSIGNVSDLEYLDLKKDGVGRAQLQCGVFANGDGTFEAEGKMTLDADFLTFRIPSMSPSATQAEPSTGFLTFRNGTTVNVFQSAADVPCNFWVQGNEQVDAGLIWVNFECPQMVQGMQSCVIEPSTIAMQNCDQ